MRFGERSNPPPVTQRADASSVSSARPSSSPRVSLGTRQLVTFLRAKSAKNGYCWWKQGTIAGEMERGLRTVNRQIAEAIGAGLIRSERHGHVNIYTPCDLIGKVAHREAAVEKPAHFAAAGVSDTPNWRIESPSVSITEILKPEKKNQSECTVQEHQEPAGAATDPSPFEKAQTDAIAHAVRACGFEPTPDLMAKLDHKRRNYTVTGFVVASAINRAFKLVEGTSNYPRKPAWFTTVVENALKAKSPRSTEQHGTCGETPAAPRANWTPAPHTPAMPSQPRRILELAVVGDQATHQQPATKPEPTCARCQDFGVRRHATNSHLQAWCDCPRGLERRAREPGYVDAVNRAIVQNRALIRPITSDAKPRPPKRALASAAEVLPGALLGALG
jgi:hypothetical protein